jgi:3-methyl-2-oxobutanoate hydroxymethyltransferase
LSLLTANAKVAPMSAAKITAETLRSWKGRRRIAALTAYDHPMAKLLDEAGIPLILVGDSLGMVVLGYPDTTLVTMDEMEHHVRAVARARPQALVAADLPFASYNSSTDAVRNARRLIAAGAEAVKAEGGRDIAAQVRAIVADGIPFLGHLGMLPQHIHEEGRYRIKGRIEAEHQALLADADDLVSAGAFGIVLELIAPRVAQEITERIPIPTIGIGSGPMCDGQVLVVNDLVGTFPWFTPRFIKSRVNAFEQMRIAIQDWARELCGTN